MSLSPEELEEFKMRYDRAFNIRLSDGEAFELADRLEGLYRVVLNRSAGPSEMPRAPSPPWRPKSQIKGEENAPKAERSIGPGTVK